MFAKQAKTSKDRRTLQLYAWLLMPTLAEVILVHGVTCALATLDDLLHPLPSEGMYKEFPAYMLA